MGSFSVSADIAKNRLNWKAEGFLSDDEFKLIVVQIKKEVDKLKPGFIVISNSPNFKPGSPFAVETMKQIFEYQAQKGVKKTISVTVENPLGWGAPASAAPRLQGLPFLKLI